MNRILAVMRTPGAMLAALVLALIAQLEHTAQVFMLVVGAQGWQAQLHAYAFALAVETAVLLFVLAGHKWISYGFALATFATNLSYYAMQGVNLLSIHGAPAWLMSLLLPAAIVGYSHTIAETPQGPHGDATTSSNTTVAADKPTQAQAGTTGHSGDMAAEEHVSETPVLPATPLVVLTTQPPRKQAQRKPNDATLTPAQRQAQIAESGETDYRKVAAQFNVSVRTAQNDIAAVRSAIMQSNGATHE